MFKRLFLLPLLIASQLLAADFPDGAWNGKPWPREELRTQAEAGNADAMAEWAFDAWLMTSDLPYDWEKILSYARRSAKKGSLLGKTMCGVFMREGYHQPMNAPAGVKLIMEAAKAGHPHAMHVQALYMLRGIYDGQAIKGLPRDRAAALKLYHKARKLGAVATMDTEWRILLWGAEGVVDRNLAYAKAMECMKEYSTDSVLAILYFAIRKSKGKFHDLLTPADKKTVQQAMEKAAVRGHEWAVYRIEEQEGRNTHLLDADTNIHIGIPFMLKDAHAGVSPTTFTIFYYLRRLRWNKRDRPVKFLSSVNGLYNFSIHLFENGYFQDDYNVALFYLYYKLKMLMD